MKNLLTGEAYDGDKKVFTGIKREGSISLKELHEQQALV